MNESQLVKNKENFRGESKKARGASANLSVPKAGLDENQVVQNKESFGGESEKLELVPSHKSPKSRGGGLVLYRIGLGLSALRLV